MHAPAARDGKRAIVAVDFASPDGRRVGMIDSPPIIAAMDSRFSQMPSALRTNTRWERLGPSAVPVMLVHPGWKVPAPLLLWMHGRTANKELDPGRYLRLMRGGIAVCAIDLPGHGERFDDALQAPHRTLDVVLQMAEEIDEILAALGGRAIIDRERLAIGGMSAGGMASMVRLCRPHAFRCAAVEATSGSWQHQRHRQMFCDRNPKEISRFDPINHLSGWQEIPFLALHARHDEWVGVEGQSEFIEALRGRSTHPELIEFVTYDHTGAPWEHVGFGRFAADAKNRQRDFLVRHLDVTAPAPRSR